MTSHLATFGAINISRDEYLQRLGYALSRDCEFA
jgi:Leu/Phe-tRNA-protein transferase